MQALFCRQRRGSPRPLRRNPTSSAQPNAVGPAYLDEFGRDVMYLLRVSGTTSVTYSLQVNTSGAPTVQVAIDDQLLQTIGATTPPAVSVTLTPGLHTLRLRLAPPATQEVVIDSVKFTATTSGGGGGTGALSGTSAAASGAVNPDRRGNLGLDSLGPNLRDRRRPQGDGRKSNQRLYENRFGNRLQLRRRRGRRIVDGTERPPQASPTRKPESISPD